jgi:plasmid stability protein
MPNVSIKNVPEEIMESLRTQAKRHHRSLQGELIAILEEAVQPKRLTVADVHLMIVESGIETQRESVQMIREDRDAR